MQFEPFEVSVPEDRISDLRARLRNTRYPDDIGNDDWKYGTSRSYLESFVESWLDYDWRATEKEINSFDNYKTTIDGVPIHFLRKRGKGPNPVPLLLTHGWPWTFWDYKDAVGYLTDPSSFGDGHDLSFDVVVPSIPGFGFSTPIHVEGVGTSATADIWAKLMTGLGYDKFFAAGGDFGVPITGMLAHKYPEHVLGIHTTIPPLLGSSREGQPGETVLQMLLRRFGGPTEAMSRDDYAPDERHRWDLMRERWLSTVSHVAAQTTDPQTLSYGMHDSPIALASWILERRCYYSDNNGNIEDAFSRKFLLDLVSIYWFTDSFVSSARYYWNSFRTAWEPTRPGRRTIEVPVGVPLFAKELAFMPRKVVEDNLNLVHWTEYPKGGHFAASEVPEVWSKDLRDFVLKIR